MKLLLALLLSFNIALASADTQVCFTPQQDCTSLIVKQIESAKESVNMQAYVFTSMPIANALLYDQDHHINVQVIADHSDFTSPSQAIVTLIEHKVPLWNDTKVKIAHNKVIIIDNKRVVTGSFNWTYAAQESNAENVIVIDDPKIAALYNVNFDYRQRLSTRWLPTYATP